MSFSGLKTAVLTVVTQLKKDTDILDEQTICDICLAFQEAVVDVLTIKAKQALADTGMDTLVVAGGVGANKALRASLYDLPAQVYFPDIALCTDNGAMIAFAGAMRLQQRHKAASFDVRPRWALDVYAQGGGQKHD